MHIGHMIVSSAVHGLVYAAIFKIGHNIGLTGMIVLAVGGIALIWIIARSMGNRR